MRKIKALKKVRIILSVLSIVVLVSYLILDYTVKPIALPAYYAGMILLAVSSIMMIIISRLEKQDKKL